MSLAAPALALSTNPLNVTTNAFFPHFMAQVNTRTRLWFRE
jgi:hypothetical protein